MDEQSYRSLVDATLERIDAAFGDVDPDLAESNISQGALTLVFPGGTKAIVSAQPPVRQIWLAYTDHAWHFDLDAATGRWMDDRGKGEDLFVVLSGIAKDAAGVDVTIS